MVIRKFIGLGSQSFILAVLVAAAASAMGQVSPTEVVNPRARADEQKYMPQLVSLQKTIGTADFPFTFRLARYLDAKPGQRAALDSNGIEFVYFQQRIVLKISGFYRVAFNSVQVTQNGRASQTVQDAVLPILRIISEQMPKSYDYDAIGFEILYDARDSGRSYDYEGREVLTAVFARDDAFALATATTNEERQEILNRSDIFVNGKEFGLALGQSEPLNVEALDKAAPKPALERASFTAPKKAHVVADAAAVSHDVVEKQNARVEDPVTADLEATVAQRKLQAEVSAMKEDGAAAQVDISPAALETSGDQKMLHFTMASALSFDGAQSSIYKRAAQSFDLFLAPELKEISKKVPSDAGIDAVHFSVLNRLAAGKSETVEYICPVEAMRSFVQDKITTQDLINKSKVLVNGVRIGIDLQVVE